MAARALAIMTRSSENIRSRNEERAKGCIPVKSFSGDFILYLISHPFLLREARTCNFPGRLTRWSSVIRKEREWIEEGTSNCRPSQGTDVRTVLEEHHRGGRPIDTEMEGYLMTLSVAKTPTSLRRGPRKWLSTKARNHVLELKFPFSQSGFCRILSSGNHQAPLL